MLYTLYIEKLGVAWGRGYGIDNKNNRNRIGGWKCLTLTLAKVFMYCTWKFNTCKITNMIGGLSSTLNKEEAVNNETGRDHHSVHRVGDGVGERTSH